LASRGITIPPPSSLRFHPALRHPDDAALWPAMVALVTTGIDNIPVAIHRTYLARDGRGKAPLAKQKVMLGPCHGGAVRLGNGYRELMIGEGIETCLSALQMYKYAAWAALSTSGLKNLELPRDAKDIVILGDLDQAGVKAAEAAQYRWE